MDTRNSENAFLPKEKRGSIKGVEKMEWEKPADNRKCGRGVWTSSGIRQALQGLHVGTLQQAETVLLSDFAGDCLCSLGQDAFSLRRIFFSL